ncbi:hypothetical protein Nos7524_3583 [Nostoc sp. PCC 7524]|uniref:hypothetical protein n=1 Tax=Nostoc sp. (strain ATCC 29411 / PCC 7524) TaxID=28072 RepID=UPI00029F4BF7|nr:hypothetical protein [Nostoc sp. PCC 7524]AFY49374.1 hypothetical protein Nos7524_3583 [Nostoc sp. PCC 7524]
MRRAVADTDRFSDHLEIFYCSITCIFIKSMFNCLELAAKTNHQGIKKYYFQYILPKECSKEYKKISELITGSDIKTKSVSSNINN